MVSVPPRALAVFSVLEFSRLSGWEGGITIPTERGTVASLLCDGIASFGSIMVLLIGPREWKMILKPLGQMLVALQICAFDPLIT